MQLFYKGVEISGTTKPSACVMRDSAGGEADALSVVFPDVSALWPGWGPERGDVMRYVNGDFDSGDLYVDNAAFTSGGFRVDAVSVPPEARRKNTRIWRKVRLSEIIGDIASRCGLTAKTYGITDYTYRAISQASEPDIAFLSRICLREGYAVKVSGGGLIVYAEKRMEAQPPALTIARADVRPGYLFYRGTGQLSSVTVSFCDAAAGETYTQSATDGTMPGGAARVIELCANGGEAERFAKGYLRAANKGARQARLTLTKQIPIAAGSTVSLSGFSAGENGNWFVSGVDQDAVSNLVAVNLRAPLNY